MSFVNEFEEKATPFEKKYYNFLSEVKDPIKRESTTNDILEKDHFEFIRPNLAKSLNPHEGFVNAFNEREEKNKAQTVRERAKFLYNEEGKRFARPWDYTGFSSIHDPIGVFKKKGNYEDLAWKVYNDVDDKDVYLKVLYYPALTSDDLHTLFDKFEEQLRCYNNKVRFSYVLSAGSVLGTWSLAYLYRFKFASFAVSTFAAFFAVHFCLNTLYSKQMKNSLNFVAQDIAKKYPQIKYSKVEYTKSSQIITQKFI